MSDIQRFYVVAVTVSKSNLINFESSFLYSKTHITSVTYQVQWLHSQGFQLSRIERESPAWTLFLPLSRQACKISRINEKNPAKRVGKNLTK